MISVSAIEVRKAIAAAKGALREGSGYLSCGNLDKAAMEMERAQHLAFQAKDLIRNGGRFEEEGI